MKDIDQVADGEINSAAAYHLLSEVYLGAGMPREAVNAATRVIKNPKLGLMKERFGSRANEDGKDVYWDLFRRGNQNRSAGNTEGIWVIQFETNILGGGSTTTSFDGSYAMERMYAPLFRDIITSDRESPFLWPIGDYTGGRGIGWGISTTYYSDTIWESDFKDDIRNANHNFVRKFVSNNPNSRYYGDTIDTANPPAGITVPSRVFYAFPTMVTTPFNHPDNLYIDKSTFFLSNSAGGTYRDIYMFRLADTYLLRAEGYLDLEMKDSSAADINKVRERAHASDVSASDVDINYILDERMRELGVEENRRVTLMRLELLYDRVKKCNPYYSDVEEKFNLWPIPQSVIEANSDAVIEQNTGY